MMSSFLERNSIMNRLRLLIFILDSLFLANGLFLVKDDPYR